MESDIPTILLYIFIAVIQNYIFFSVGIYTGLKKLWSQRTLRCVSELLMNFFLPFYATLELARMASWPNVEIMWILIISVFISISLGFVLAVIIHRLFNLDVRFKNSYPYLVSMPSMGSMPLVLGRALCYPGGMLEDDPQCSNVQGFMLMNFLIFQTMLFIFGFLLMPKDANFSNVLSDKLSHMWHTMYYKLFDKNYSILNIMLKFIKDQNTAKKLFSVFDRKYKLEKLDSEINRYKFIENNDIELDCQLEVQKITEKVLDHTNIEPQKASDKKFSCKSLKGVSNFENIELNGIGDSINFVELELEPQVLLDQLFRSEALGNNIGLITEEKIDMQLNNVTSPDEHFDENYFKNNNNDIETCHEVHSTIEMVKIKSDESIEENKIKTQPMNSLKKLSFKEKSTDAEKYYEKLFEFVESNLNKEKEKEFIEYKKNSFNGIKAIPPKFPLEIKNVTINLDMIKVINEEWNKFENSVKINHPDFKLTSKEIPFSFNLIISKVYSPPIIGCFCGLMIGMSGMREVLFSTNHYVSNIVNGIEVVTKAAVPIIFINLGVSMLSIKFCDPLNTPLTKKYVILSFVHRFIIMPGIGLIYVYLWKTYFGGIITASKVFRISVFVPFCLPCTSVVVVIVNIIKYFADETGIMLFIHNFSIVITLTILYLIYYVVLG
jgi:hypothetical protein